MAKARLFSSMPFHKKLFIVVVSILCILYGAYRGGKEGFVVKYYMENETRLDENKQPIPPPEPDELAVKNTKIAKMNESNRREFDPCKLQGLPPEICFVNKPVLSGPATCICPDTNKLGRYRVGEGNKCFCDD